MHPIKASDWMRLYEEVLADTDTTRLELMAGDLEEAIFLKTDGQAEMATLQGATASLLNIRVVRRASHQHPKFRMVMKQTAELS